MRAFRIAYDGRPYHGYQRQPSVPTVEGTLFDALDDLGLFDADEGKPPGYAAAGRTDAGVSARAQTVAFNCPDWCTPRALNGQLPATVRAWAAADAPDDFHATHDAARREYAYDLYAPAADDGRAAAAAAALSGEHDFHNLTADDAGTVRTLSVDVERDGDFLLVRVAAGGFCYQLVRRLTTVVHGVATGDRPLDGIDAILGPDPLSGADGVPPAPPEPLVLERVRYPGLTFERDPEAVDSAVRVFETRRRDGLVRARVATRIRRGIEGGEDGEEDDDGDGERDVAEKGERDGDEDRDADRGGIGGGDIESR